MVVREAKDIFCFLCQKNRNVEYVIKSKIQINIKKSSVFYKVLNILFFSWDIISKFSFLIFYKHIVANATLIILDVRNLLKTIFQLQI